MKTAISVEDELLIDADGAAREMGVSRSRLVSLALAEYLRNRGREKMLERLNRVYAAPPDAAEKRAVARMKRKFRATIRERW